MRDIIQLRSNVYHEFRQILSHVNCLQRDTTRIVRLYDKLAPTLRQHAESDCEKLGPLVVSVDWDVNRLRNLIWKASDVVDCGFLHSLVNEQNQQRTIVNTWDDVAKEFNLLWVEESEDPWDSGPQPSSPGDETDWEAPSVVHVDSV